ncbi:hypothetical protein BD324DRAFT_622706 [Kockovaella imperatae]|uniref:Uncharacterized protein n=1 Tax=Kockovaella imperatae TaxID=4999 RepID=A0A1Y1UJG6_9TREE|nr:hypothetical protein BD324DRAFT_622706 [Kockovaella imperatae]ORX37644.1 hypothetical protein BD324DRAFT_622706 [Kockovaella imperatae]
MLVPLRGALRSNVGHAVTQKSRCKTQREQLGGPSSGLADRLVIRRKVKPMTRTPSRWHLLQVKKEFQKFADRLKKTLLTLILGIGSGRPVCQSLLLL